LGDFAIYCNKSVDLKVALRFILKEKNVTEEIIMTKFFTLSVSILTILFALTGCAKNATLLQSQDIISHPVISEIIDSNLDIITSSPASSSNPGDYIHSHEAEYNEIVALGDDALQYMFSKFDEGGQYGLRGWIMALACCDILGVETEFNNPIYQTGQAWYDSYMKADTPNTRQPSILLNNTYYFITGLYADIEYEEENYMGRTTSEVPLSEIPREHGQSNYVEEGTPYAEHYDGVVVLIDDKWMIFETWDESLVYEYVNQ